MNATGIVNLDSRERFDEIVRMFAAFAGIVAEPLRTRRLQDRIRLTERTWTRVSDAYGTRRTRDFRVERSFAVRPVPA